MTIKQSAEKYTTALYKEVQGGRSYYELDQWDKGVLDGIDPYAEKAYIEGANFVIQEIEKKLDQLREDYKSLWTNTYLREFINQLKQ